MKNNFCKVFIAFFLLILCLLITTEIFAEGDVGSLSEEEGVCINVSNFPDNEFRNYISSELDTDRNGYLSDDEITAVTVIDFIPADSEWNLAGSGNSSGFQTSKPVESLSGLSFFSELQSLSCDGHRLTALDVSQNTKLQEMYCSGNLLEQLNLEGNRDLRILDCHDNQALADLNLSNCAELMTLDCSGTDLTDLSLSDYSMLEEVNCGSNLALISVNVSGCAALKVISCNDCPQLSNLDICGCDDLGKLECCNGNLAQLNIGSCQRLSDLTCYGNQIDAIDLMPSNALSTITECYDPVIDNGIAFYNYEGHKIAFDTDVVLVNIEPDFFLPASLNTIGEEAFMGCAFRYIVLPEQTTCIGANAFADCGNLLCIRIPDSVVQIDDNAFGNLTGFVIFGTPGSETEAFAQEHGYSFIPTD